MVVVIDYFYYIAVKFKAFMKSIQVVFLLWLSVSMVGCLVVESGEGKSYGSQDWLSGTDDERWSTVADQFGGFAHAMHEIQYRYQELYWAGLDGNWEYALHHLEHIEEAMEAGLERRPARAKSATSFVNDNIPTLEKVLEDGDSEGFEAAFEVFRISCNSCHAMEDMPFIHVKTPEIRMTVIGLPN